MQQEHDRQEKKKVLLRIERQPAGKVDLGEYGYVIADLRRVAIVAAVVFGLLIAVSLLLR